MPCCLIQPFHTSSPCQIATHPEAHRSEPILNDIPLSLVLPAEVVPLLLCHSDDVSAAGLFLAGHCSSIRSLVLEDEDYHFYQSDVHRVPLTG